MKDVNRDKAKLAIDGVSWFRNQVEGKKSLQGDRIYEAFREDGLRDFILWIAELFSSKTPELARRQVVAATYATFTANETAAREFWHQVSRGGIDYDDTARQQSSTTG